MSEALWHQTINIQDSQSGLFPVEVIDGAAHYQFASESNIPKDVKKSDLIGTIDTATVWSTSSEYMAIYIYDTLYNFNYTPTPTTTHLLSPLVDAMENEGYVNLKPPCNSDDQINPDLPTCQKDTPWVTEYLLQTWMPNPQSWNSLIRVTNNDNTHSASEVFPYHHPETVGTCSADTTEACSVEHISNTQVNWPKFSDMKIQKNQLSADEVMTKIKSHQYIAQQAGLTDASFEELDEQNNECALINQSVLDWATNLASDDALNAYQTYGTPLLMGEDKESINGGSWIIDGLKWKSDTTANTMTLISKTVVTDQSELIGIFKNMHYCKLLSTFRAMEWIYVDSLYATQGLDTLDTGFTEVKEYLE